MHVRLLAVLALLAAPSATRVPTTGPAPAPVRDLHELLERFPADSLVVPLRRFEAEHGREPSGGDAALMLGRLHYARGEYVQAAAAFSRAAARLDPAHKPEARYWSGLSLLALKQSEPARSALEEVALSSSPRAAEARFGVALAFEQSGRLDRAYDELGVLLSLDPGEAGAAALERFIAIGEQLHRADAEKARARLLREYPRSIEAARAFSPARELPPSARNQGIAVQIGAFASPSRARSLLRAAERAGFTGVEVIERGEGPARLFVVRLGSYSTADEARTAGEKAAARLGITYKLEGPS